jgi:3-oxoacyl-[acyl-carrier protein] reductase
MEIRLDGEVAVVTGAASGIGRGVALSFAAAGAAVVALDKAAGGLAAVTAEIVSMHGSCSAHEVDVSAPDQVDAAIEAARQQLGDATVLVTAAAIDESVNVAQMSRQQWTRMIDVNLHGTFYCLQAVLPGMRRAGRGRIILFGSNIALKGGMEIAHYGAAKGAIHALARCAALDLAAMNITVNVMAPGPIQTPMLDSLPQEWLDDKLASMPLGRFGAVDEVVPTVVLLASAAGAFYTGATMNVSGGDAIL